MFFCGKFWRDFVFFFAYIGNNRGMKKEIAIKYGANADEKESFLPPELCPQEVGTDTSVRKESL